MLVPAGCDALSTDSLSQQTIAIATAASMQVGISHVSYGCCSSGNSRRLSTFTTSPSSLRYLASNSFQSISAKNLVAVLLLPFSSVDNAQALFSVLPSHIEWSQVLRRFFISPVCMYVCKSPNSRIFKRKLYSQHEENFERFGAKLIAQVSVRPQLLNCSRR